MSDIWFTSDTHYGHSKIIEYSERPFSSVEEMEEVMVANWRAVVKPGDRCYHLGDFGFMKPESAIRILKRLPGQKFLLFGNHDKQLRESDDFVKAWTWAKDYAEITFDKQKIILGHYPFLSWNRRHHKSWNLHGHCHGSIPDGGDCRLDVGVDCFDYRPVSFGEIREIFRGRSFYPVDHHGADRASNVKERKLQFAEFWKTNDPYTHTTEKHCNKCDKTMPSQEFGRCSTMKDGLYWFCRRCNIDTVRESKYGMAIPDNASCEVCGSAERLCVDHDHVTGATRGILCSACNFSIGHARDRSDVLRGAADYLDRHAAKKIGVDNKRSPR